MTHHLLSLEQSLAGQDGFGTSPFASPSPSALNSTLDLPVLPMTSGPANLPAAFPPPLQPGRCAVKGCVFPASLEGARSCRYHELVQSEGQLFQSHQPSHLLAVQAPADILDIEPDDSRHKDRTRRAAEREAFLLDEPA